LGKNIEFGIDIMSAQLGTSQFC